MDFNLSEEIMMLKEMARDFTENEIAPNADKWDEEHFFPRDVIKKMGELGFFGCVIPEEYGGNDMGFLAQSILTEEIARGSSSLRVAFNMQTLGSALEILRYGSDATKKKYIPDLVTGDTLGCFGITEPNAGSDTLAMKTTADDKGDYYALNGSKTWISNAQVADSCIVYAYTDKSIGSKGLSAIGRGPQGRRRDHQPRLTRWAPAPPRPAKFTLKTPRSPRRTSSASPATASRSCFRPSTRPGFPAPPAAWAWLRPRMKRR